MVSFKFSKSDFDTWGDGVFTDCVILGREDAFITRALLAQLAQRLGHQQIVVGGGGDEDEEGEATILLNNNDEGCNIM